MGDDSTNGEVMRAIGQLEGKFDGFMKMLSDVVNRMAGIETKMDNRFEDVHNKISKKDEDLDKRLRKVERRVFVIWLIGGGAFSIILAIIGASNGFFTHL